MFVDTLVQLISLNIHLFPNDKWHSRILFEYELAVSCIALIDSLSISNPPIMVHRKMMLSLPFSFSNGLLPRLHCMQIRLSKFSISHLFGQQVLLAFLRVLLFADTDAKWERIEDMW